MSPGKKRIQAESNPATHPAGLRHTNACVWPLPLRRAATQDTATPRHREGGWVVRYALESDLGLPQLTPPICLYPQRPVWRLDSLRAISRASGYDAPCAVVPARHYSKQRAQSTMHTSGILCLIDKCAASIRYLLQGRRRSPNYKGKDEPLGRAALSLSLSHTGQGAPGTLPVPCTPAVFFGCCAAY